MEEDILNKTILKYLNNELSEIEANEFEKYLEGSEKEKKYFEDIKLIYQSTKKIELPDFNQKTAYKKAKENMRLNKSFISTISLSILKIAAVLIFGLIIGMLVMKNLPEKKSQFVEIHVKQGERVNISLPDGNKIYINSNTTLKYPANFSGKDRKIFLEGEAFFEIKSDEANPILVCIRDNIIYGNNSSFNIKNYSEDDNVEIIVEQGWLSVMNDKLENKTYVLEAGYKGIINKFLPLFIEKNANYNSLAWKTGKLEFENTPLKIVANDLSNCYKVAVQINDNIKYCEFSSVYENKNLDEILNDLIKIYDFKITRETNKIIINGDEC